MNLTAVTITVSFVGLINFQEMPGGRKVIVPMAPDERVVAMKKLVPHRADLVITGLSTTACGNLATLVPATKWSATTSTCTLSGLSGHEIVLPAPAPADFQMTDNFKAIPKLSQLCTGIGGLNPALGQAVTLTITHGKLDAALNGQAWISRLELTAPTGNFTLKKGTDSKTVILEHGAAVTLHNAPVIMDSGTTEEQHFWWYYVMYQNTSGCTRLPTVRRTAGEARSRLPAHLHDHPVASGVGCSNTGYP